MIGSAYHEDVVIVKVDGNGELWTNELDQLDALFAIHGLAWCGAIISLLRKVDFSEKTLTTMRSGA